MNIDSENITRRHAARRTSRRSSPFIAYKSAHSQTAKGVQKSVAEEIRLEFRESNVQYMPKKRDLQEVTLEHTYIKLVLSAKKPYRFNFGSI